MNLFKVLIFKALIFKLLFMLAIAPAWGASYYGGGSALKAHGHSAVGDGGVITNLSILGVMYPKQYRETTFSATIATSSYALSWSSGSIANITVSSNTTLSFLNALSGETLTLFITAGASTGTITWPNVKWPDQIAPQLSTTPAKVDIIGFFLNGTTYYGFPNGFEY